MIALYRGVFLDGDDESFVHIPRERLRAKFLAFIQQYGAVLARRGEHTEATALYNKGLEVEPFAEPFYQGLMRALHALAQPAEALQAYRRCQKILSTHLAIDPSADTQALAREIGRSQS